ncbi:MAG: hypothetical protein JST58_03690 [Bacteroidetes bacterium]|nr:hypothetical protein [Bacteroidota bacterium]
MDWRYNTIWFSQLNNNNICNQDFTVQKNLKENFDKVEYAILKYYKFKEYSFANLPQSDKLIYLDFDWANFKDLQGIDRFKHLKRLELHYCLKLENDKGLKSLKNTLQHLHISQSKKFEHSRELYELKKLKVLCLNSCAPIANLKFLNHFPELLDFRFVNTNILDGDLTPILEHPTIRTVGFLNKRHYNYSDKKIEAELSLKSTKEYTHITLNGQFKTFRYDYE